MELIDKEVAAHLSTIGVEHEKRDSSNDTLIQADAYQDISISGFCIMSKLQDQGSTIPAYL